MDNYVLGRFKNSKRKGEIVLDIDAHRGAKVKANVLKRHMANWEARLEMSDPVHKQLKHLIALFGGITPFAVAVQRHPNYILRHWLGVNKDFTLDKRRPSGLLSVHFLRRVIFVSRHWGILLRPQDLYPDLIEGDVVRLKDTNKELREWISKTAKAKNMQELEDTLALLASTPD